MSEQCKCAACDLIQFVVVEVDSRPFECVLRDGFSFNMTKAMWDSNEFTSSIVKKALTNMEHPRYYVREVKLKFATNKYIVSFKVFRK